MSARIGNLQISQITRATLSGSSEPLTNYFPRCKGVLLRPSGKAQRRIKLACSWHIASKTKTQIEALHHALNEELATGGRDLSVHGNVYSGVIPVNTSFDILTANEYFTYALDFELSETQNFFNSLVANDQVRVGYFNYEYGDADEQLSEFKFYMLNNWEAASSCEFEVKELPRKLLAAGGEKEQASGLETIDVQCWITKEPIKELDAYFFNYMAACGPLGKRGTLYLDGNEYKDAIMTSFESDEPTGGGSENNARYRLQFKVSLQC